MIHHQLGLALNIRDIVTLKPLDTCVVTSSLTKSKMKKKAGGYYIWNNLTYNNLDVTIQCRGYQSLAFSTMIDEASPYKYLLLLPDGVLKEEVCQKVPTPETELELIRVSRVHTIAPYESRDTQIKVQSEGELLPYALAVKSGAGWVRVEIERVIKDGDYHVLNLKGVLAFDLKALTPLYYVVEGVE
ncbi:MAG: hypothetical protein JXO44_02460 [Clostridia bacterium]|nr:hypothetical protein [Clostridia bacterium]